ncbi:hypothetical protein IW141_004860, partial [Coemansia sp. RSA 355]
MADNVHYMASFVENVMSVMPSAFDDIEIVRKDDALPTDIGVILAEIAYNIGTTQKYGSLIADAAQNIADIEDQSDDSEVAQIVSSLYNELNKQNDAKEAASLA